MENYIKMDWTLKQPEERVAKVNEIINNTPSEKLTPNYLAKLAEYICYPVEKKERLKNYLSTDNRMVTINKRETSYDGLASKLKNGEDGIYNMMINDKNVLLDPPRQDITQEELDTIPGLKELKEAIAVVEEERKIATGRKKFLLNQQLIEMRQDQYVIRNAYKQPIPSRLLTKTLSKINLDEKIEIAGDEITSSCPINFFTPVHIVTILCNYSKLKMETWEDFNSDMRWMLLDFERLIDAALKEKYPMYYKILIYKIDGKTNLEIQELIQYEFGIKHSVEYISSLWRKKIPKIIKEYAEAEWIIWHYTAEERGHWKRCSRCKEIKLANSRFFSKNSSSKDGWYSICKNCRNKKK